ncbi:MAG: protein DA1 [Lentisphaeria bacterium]|nr:protein DA1 [Candidatus Neomarinimicrobiota bacterium]MCF7842093.1 protein DA1 [Lentisphaeria bacterium]
MNFLKNNTLLGNSASIRRIFLFTLVFIAVLTGSDKHCRYCGELITGSYVQVHGYFYHPHHFLCAHCEKPIQGKFQKEDNRFYHPACYIVVHDLICGVCSTEIRGEYFEKDGVKYHPDCYRDHIQSRCAWCGEPITHTYFEHEGKSYHETCYRQHILPRCVICGEPLEGRYFEDAFGNQYHTRHTGEYPECDNCGRIITPQTTRGGETYSDGRHICTLCFQAAVKDLDRYYDIFHEVVKTLGYYGFTVDLNQVDIKPVNRTQLKDIAGQAYSQQLRGFCNTRTQTLNGRLTNQSHTIYVLDNVPPLAIGSTLAHELMHIWIAQNTTNYHQPKLEEGVCNYLSYIYLKESVNTSSEYMLRQLLENPDPVYGAGFRAVKSKFSGYPLRDLLDYLKSNSTL